MTSDAFRPQPRNIIAQSGGATANLHTASGSVPVGMPAHLESRSYGFKELAVLYFPNIAPASASIRLKAWIKDSPRIVASPCRNELPPHSSCAYPTSDVYD